MNTIYILSIILITLVTNASLSFAMPYMKAQWNAFITRIKPKKHTPTPSTKQLEKLVIDIMKNKTNSGLLTYHKQKMLREFVREEVVNYLNQIKNK